MIDPGANINCVAYEWINCYDTPEWCYSLECGSVKVTGAHIKIETGVFLKLSWPPEDPVISVDQWFHIVHGGVVLHTLAFQALGIIDGPYPP